MNKNIKKIYQIIWEKKLVVINFDDPFIWKSNKISPIYLDLRKSFSYFECYSLIVKETQKLILKHLKPDFILGIATAGISHAAIIANSLKIASGYGKKEGKGYGKDKVIEGHIKDSKNIILIDDVCSTGSSLIRVYDFIKNKKDVKAVVYAFSYEIDASITNFKNLNLPFYYLLNVKDLLTYGVKNGFIDQKTKKKVLEFTKNF